MNSEMKPDATQFIHFIDELKNKPWLGHSRRWWPNFIFHFTNINNAVKILETGKLLSRHKLEKMLQGMVTDNASPSVIGQTDERWKNHVRLYFRPRTPTQHSNEGFRPKSSRELDAHCPVPIYFLFDSKKLLSRKEVRFSKRSLAIAGTEVFTKFDDFKNIPFHLVYHNDSFEPYERNMIIQHRQAEVIVPEELDLKDLKYIWCRSEAEYRTLLDLLSEETKKKWLNKIGSGIKGNFFVRKWFFVENVSLSNKSIQIKFNLPAKIIDGSFFLRLEIIEEHTGRVYVWEDQHFTCNKPSMSFGLNNLLNPSHYRVRLFGDGQLLFSDVFQDDPDLPF